jgi:D-alanyl-D-alanine carboxypeptidase (penicillin-binding protein 5/6)
MRFKARGLGITESTWTTPEGLDAEGQLATARDLATVARNLLTYPVLARIVQTRDYDLPWPGGHVRLHARNHFLFHYRGAIGVKPGYTTRARNTLAAAAQRNGRILIAVVMRTPTPTTDAAMLLDEQFEKAAPTPKKKPLKLFFAAAAATEPAASQPAEGAPDAIALPIAVQSTNALPLALGAYLVLGSVLCTAVFVWRAARRRTAA